ncbi:hypothetical protein IEO21_01421 [Rhodonia placenta]|uniref:Mechanosensitive ion channel protein n=1 Tax=Rhodonia placenta TaxID=104341 RepID=A0A8H7P9T5_9APHY|nr:hypothetical protein IEO21_01421 [Postia placenta]
MPEPKPRDYVTFDSRQNSAHQRTETAEYGRPHHSRSSGSWDLLGGIRHSYVDYDPRRASQAHLAFAEGDIPNNAFAKVYNYLLDVSIITRWIIFIIPVLGLLWIPGILGFTAYPDTTIWGVKLVWWSIWLTVVWCGWWGALASSMVLPHIARHTVGVVSVWSRKYIDWLQALHRYIAFFGWTLAIWISFQPLVNTRRVPDTSSGDAEALSTLAKLLFALFECALILLAEKLCIQWIATQFHQRSYAERVANQKFAIRVLVSLYRRSSDIPWRSDTLHEGHVEVKRPRRLLKKALHGVKFAATTTTTALGNVASEMMGTSVLQPNSPPAMVKTAIESPNKSRMLARRLFYSFVKPGANALTVDDIMPFFPTPEDAEAAFVLFDKDMNGDVTRDEIEIACMEVHREQLSIEHSMRDLDSAVGRLDNIFMTIYFFVVLLIFAVALEAQLLTLVTSAGTFVLGLSWLIGTSLGEVLTSIIFLFVKHPYDVGDRLSIDQLDYTVKEIRLLSTVFLDSNACSVQAPHSLLNTKFIQNMRRSPQMSETFTFDVNFGTTFEQIEQLRELMLTFLKMERRDFQPIFDVSILDIPAQEKMMLTADIRYKGNWQQGTLKTTRRNKWISALKTAMQKAKVFGPAGDPGAIPAPDRLTLVPWEQIEAADKKKLQKEEQEKKRGGVREMSAPTADWNLTDKQAIMMDDTQDVFGEANSVTSFSTDPSRPVTRPPSVEGGARRRYPSGPAQPVPMTSVTTHSPLVRQTQGDEEIEMRTSPRRSPGSPAAEQE